MAYQDRDKQIRSAGGTVLAVGIILCIASLIAAGNMIGGGYALVIPFLGITLGGVLSIMGAAGVMDLYPNNRGPALPPGPQWAQMPPPNTVSSIGSGTRPIGALPQQPGGPTCSKCLSVNEPGALVCDECGAQFTAQNVR